MDWLLQILLGAWWFGDDGRSKSADAADKYLVPVLAGFSVCVIVA